MRKTNKPLILVSVIASMMAAAGGVKAEADGDACEYTRPVRVLNGETGQYTFVHMKTERGWCASLDMGINSPLWATESSSNSESDSGEGDK